MWTTQSRLFSLTLCIGWLAGFDFFLMKRTPVTFNHVNTWSYLVAREQMFWEAQETFFTFTIANCEFQSIHMHCRDVCTWTGPKTDISSWFPSKGKEQHVPTDLLLFGLCGPQATLLGRSSNYSSVVGYFPKLLRQWQLFGPWDFDIVWHFLTVLC